MASSSDPQAIDSAAYAPDARGRAILRGLRIAEADLREAGGTFGLDEVRLLLRGISRQAVDKRVQEGRLIAVPGPSNRRRYPTFQFGDDGSIIAGLDEIKAALPTRNPWAVLNFFTRPDASLDGRRPVDLLKAGEIEAVVAAARRYGEPGS